MTNHKTEMPDVLYVHDHNGLKVTKEPVWPETLSSIREYTYIRADLSIPRGLAQTMVEALQIVKRTIKNGDLILNGSAYDKMIDDALADLRPSPSPDTIPLELGERMYEVIKQIQFGFNYRRCPACVGWNMSANGETDKIHTKDCPVAEALAAFENRGKV